MLGREPTVEEVAEEAGLPVDRVVELRRVARDSVSLDTPVGDDGETTLGELIEDGDVLQAADIAEQRALTTSLRDLVATLTPREATIIKLRFGLDDGQPHTLQEVADQVGLTRERVRQLEKKALAELRDPQRHEPVLAWAS
jgi:RNA polymerase sigma factor (sigma-70 family)